LCLPPLFFPQGGKESDSFPLGGRLGRGFVNQDIVLNQDIILINYNVAKILKKYTPKANSES
jgi:hypothetical protein